MATKTLTATGTTGVALPVELGFVPTTLKLRNRTTGTVMEWNDQMAGTAPAWISTLSAAGVGGAIAVSTTSSAGISLIDGSDKASNLTKSFGFIVASAAGINATGEVLEIVAERKDM